MNLSIQAPEGWAETVIYALLGVLGLTLVAEAIAPGYSYAGLLFPLAPLLWLGCGLCTLFLVFKDQVVWALAHGLSISPGLTSRVFLIYVFAATFTPGPIHWSQVQFVLGGWGVWIVFCGALWFLFSRSQILKQAEKRRWVDGRYSYPVFHILVITGWSLPWHVIALVFCYASSGFIGFDVVDSGWMLAVLWPYLLIDAMLFFGLLRNSKKLPLLAALSVAVLVIWGLLCALAMYEVGVSSDESRWNMSVIVACWYLLFSCYYGWLAYLSYRFWKVDQEQFGDAPSPGAVTG
jgi:hypothetical protein